MKSVILLLLATSTTAVKLDRHGFASRGFDVNDLYESTESQHVAEEIAEAKFKQGPIDQQMTAQKQLDAEMAKIEKEEAANGYATHSFVQLNKDGFAGHYDVRGLQDSTDASKDIEKAQEAQPIFAMQYDAQKKLEEDMAKIEKEEASNAASFVQLDKDGFANGHFDVKNLYDSTDGEHVKEEIEQAKFNQGFLTMKNEAQSKMESEMAKIEQEENEQKPASNVQLEADTEPKTKTASNLVDEKAHAEESEVSKREVAQAKATIAFENQNKYLASEAAKKLRAKQEMKAQEAAAAKKAAEAEAAKKEKK